ncbi:MAG: RNA-binding protein [Ectothiorhodospiraceae bacterium]|nr:RNA-binding protein [Chromatiales bacterium]MCP5153851.1 RNA-binding protein [Ectothiorhodospiraceae bacterium]
MSTDDAERDGQRIDKWLWCARFFKTRGLAAEAVSGGKVQVDDARVKPARKIRPGDRLSIRREPTQWDVVVRGLSAQRLPARDAVALYEETAESLARRTSEEERARRARMRDEHVLGRPSKRDRRTLERYKRMDGADPPDS